VSRRKSSFNLATAANYLRLAFQSMSRDQEEAIREVAQMLAMAGDDPVNRILGLSGLCAGRARRVADEMDKQA
jgi:hypothetical protein